MSALALGIATALVALRCQLITDDPYVLGSVSRVLPATRPAFLRTLNATRRLIGCPVDGDVQEPQPPFLGGQCNKRYDVSITQGVSSSCADFNRTESSSTPRLWGPILGSSRGAKVCSPTGADKGPSFITASSVIGGANQGASAPRPIAGQVFDIRIDSVSVVDGSPDDCGNLPVDYPPPTSITINRDVTYNIENGDEVTVNIPFVFAPITVNFNGTLRIPLSFSLGGFEFSGDLNLPDFNLTINPPALPPGSGEDLSGEGDDAPGETVPPAPLDEKIIGVVVNAIQIDSRRVSSYSSPGIPPIFVPRLGSIKFVYSIGAATFFSSDIDIKDRRTFVPCPFSQGADAVIASPNLGVDLTFVPIRGFSLATADDIRRALAELT